MVHYFGWYLIQVFNFNSKNFVFGLILSDIYQAPEVITQKLEDPYSTKSDVYSYAVVLYEMITGKLPFMKKEQNMVGKIEY